MYLCRPEQAPVKKSLLGQQGKIFLTGASGFVGYHLIREAAARGYEVVAAVRKSSRTEHLDAFGLQYVYPDFNDIAALRAELERGQYDYVIHAAAATRAASQEAFNAANATLTRNLAAAATGITLKRFLFLSSLAVLGPQAYDSREAITEEKFPEPITGYARSKLLAEKHLADFPELPLVTLRPTVVYGPREKDLYVMMRTLSKGFEPYIGRQKQRLSFVYVTDLVRLMLDALRFPAPAGLVCNVSDGSVYEREEVAAAIKKILNRRTVRFHIPVGMVRALAKLMERLYAGSSKMPLLYPERVGEITAPNWEVSIDSAREYLNFKPEYLLERGMRESLDWYRENKWL